MALRDNKNQNSLNLFLNSYFNIIIVFVVIFVMLVSYFLIIKPKFDETVSSIKLNLEGQQKIYLSQQAKLSSLRTIASLYKKISTDDLKKFNGVLPDSYVKERLFGELEEIVKQNGFALNSVTIQNEEEKKTSDNEAGTALAANTSEKLGKINLELSVGSINYTGFKNLLRTMENNLRLFDITSVSFSPGGNSATIVLTTYYYKK